MFGEQHEEELNGMKEQQVLIQDKNMVQWIFFKQPVEIFWKLSAFPETGESSLFKSSNYAVLFSVKLNLLRKSLVILRFWHGLRFESQ